MGVFSADHSRGQALKQAPPGRLPGEHRYRGEHDHGRHSDFSDRPSNEMVWRWDYARALPLLSTLGFAAMAVRAPSYGACDVPEFRDGPQATRCFDQLAKFSSQSCSARTNTRPRASSIHSATASAIQIGAWSYPLLRWLDLGLVGISWVAVPLGAVWCTLSIWLGASSASSPNDSTLWNCRDRG